MQEALQAYVDAIAEETTFVGDFVVLMAEQDVSGGTCVRMVTSDSPMYRIDGLVDEGCRRMVKLLDQYDGEDVQ